MHFSVQEVQFMKQANRHRTELKQTVILELDLKPRQVSEMFNCVFCGSKTRQMVASSYKDYYRKDADWPFEVGFCKSCQAKHAKNQLKKPDLSVWANQPRQFQQ